MNGTAQSRKRGASTPPPVQKRWRQSEAPERACATAQPEPVHDDDDGSCSVEALLSVPINVIFREVPSSAQRQKPLLTRSEAQCLLRTSQLAQEADILLNVAAQALEHQWLSRLIHQKIEREANHPSLRSVLPILSVHGTRIPSAAIGHVQMELNRVLHELGVCANSLRQFAEQNWTLSESLLDALGDDSAPSSGQELAHEKRIVGEIQEEVYTRVERLTSMATVTNLLGDDRCAQSTLATENSAFPMIVGQETNEEGADMVDAFEHAKDPESGAFQSMADFCNRLLQHKPDFTGRGSLTSGASAHMGETNDAVSNATKTSRKDENRNDSRNADSAAVVACIAESHEAPENHDAKANPTLPTKQYRTSEHGTSESYHCQRDTAIGRRSELQPSLSFSPLGPRETAAEALAVLASGSATKASQ